MTDEPNQTNEPLDATMPWLITSLFVTAAVTIVSTIVIPIAIFLRAAGDAKGSFAVFDLFLGFFGAVFAAPVVGASLCLAGIAASRSSRPNLAVCMSLSLVLLCTGTGYVVGTWSDPPAKSGIVDFNWLYGTHIGAVAGLILSFVLRELVYPAPTEHPPTDADPISSE